MCVFGWKSYFVFSHENTKICNKYEAYIIFNKNNEHNIFKKMYANISIISMKFVNIYKNNTKL